MSSCQLNWRQACWSLELAEFNFKLSWSPSFQNPANAPSRWPDDTPQEGDSIKNVNFFSLLKDSHMDWLHADSDPLSLSHLSCLTATVLFTIDSIAMTEEFKTALAADSSWWQPFDQETNSKNIQKKGLGLMILLFIKTMFTFLPHSIQRFYSIIMTCQLLVTLVAPKWLIWSPTITPGLASPEMLAATFAAAISANATNPPIMLYMVLWSL